MTDVNWHGNPYNRKEQLAQASLPNLLFRQCHKNCVDAEVFVADKEEEKLCIANCQAKTYKAFDLMMALAMRHEANKTFENVVDISKFTGMDTETGHDTENVIRHQHGTHSQVDKLSRFTNTTLSRNQIRDKSLNL